MNFLPQDKILKNEFDSTVRDKSLAMLALARLLLSNKHSVIKVLHYHRDFHNSPRPHFPQTVFLSWGFLIASLYFKSNAYLMEVFPQFKQIAILLFVCLGVCFFKSVLLKSLSIYHFLLHKPCIGKCWKTFSCYFFQDFTGVHQTWRSFQKTCWSLCSAWQKNATQDGTDERMHDRGTWETCGREAQWLTCLRGSEQWQNEKALVTKQNQFLSNIAGAGDSLSPMPQFALLLLLFEGHYCTETNIGIKEREKNYYGDIFRWGFVVFCAE